MKSELDFCNTHLIIKKRGNYEEIEILRIKKIEIVFKISKIKIVFVIFFISLVYSILYYLVYNTSSLIFLYVLLIYFFMFHTIKIKNQYLIIKLRDNNIKIIKLNSESLDVAIKFIDHFHIQTFIKSTNKN